MKKVALLLCLCLASLHLFSTTPANGTGIDPSLPAPSSKQITTKNLPANARMVATPAQGKGVEKTTVEACDLTTYQSATIVAPSAFPYTSASGVTVSATLVDIVLLNNQNYMCGGNTFSTAPMAWWIDASTDAITLNFSASVTSFSMVVNGCNNSEIFTFTPLTGSVSLDNYCTNNFSATGNQLQCTSITSGGATGTLVRINNPAGATQYTITHNGLAAGSRISLLDCFVGDPVPVVDPVSDITTCGTEGVPAINFTGTSGATFNWANNNTSIGLAASGSGDILAFLTPNVTSQQIATVTVTPVLGPETGTPITFTITVNPKPTLTIGTLTHPATCGGTNGSIAFTTTRLPNGIYSLSYTGAGSPQNVIVIGNAFVLSGRAAGTYSNFSITNIGCTGTAAGPVTLNDPSFTWYRDMDGDGFGNPAMTQTACAQPSGYVSNNTDCDDNDPLEKPGQVWYDDTDSDGYGQTGASSITQCLRPTGYRLASELTATTGDCNDNNAAIKPGATEVCDGVDNDCDNSTDEGVQTTYYRDQDSDGFGNPAMTQMACSQPTGYVSNNTDCDDNDALEKPGQVWYDDTDSDGYGQTGSSSITQCLRPTGYRAASELTSTTGDCNDANAAIKPGATEVCDGVDNNCNGSTDEGVQTTYYRDQDGDGFGNPAMTQMACSAPTGYVSNNTDCDDNDALEYPGQVWYDDTDSDGYGQTGAASITQCLRPTGYRAASELTSTTGDCNDTNAAIKPGATEICDGVDNNCNGSTDEGVQTTYYRDQDGDGFGNPAMTQMACSAPTGYVSNNTDCDDNDALEYPGQVWYDDTDNDGYGQTGAATITQCLRPTGYRAASELTSTTGDCNDTNAAIKPGATEICDGVDNNCDTGIDEGVQTTYYEDVDQDGYGDPNSFTMDCSAPIGYVANDQDCDDNDALEHPGQVWYDDTDNDGYGQTGAAPITQCLRPTGYRAASELTSTTGDCNDTNAAIKPGATEICDGIDNNCNGSTDEGVQTTYYRDQDGDGFGNPAMTQMACSAPTGYVTDNTDCDDTDALEYPGQVWYDDTDSDGYGQTGAASITQCLRPTGYRAASELTSTTGDCNDANAAINPAATEVCDGVDNDCDNQTDENTLLTWYQDSDNDGFGNPAATQQSCSQPAGYVANSTDCDDNDALEYPGQVWYDDTDSDGYGQTGAATITQCLRPTGYRAASELTSTTGDCNDANAAINPAATEVCDGVDNNCNGSTDEGVQTTYYRDQDGDGFGNPAMTQMACSAPTGYVTNNTDCDDNDALEYPGQVWYDDTDSDGYGQTGAATITQCLRPTGYRTASELTSTTGDCNDANAAINPAATEICDGIDNNCNGATDEGTLTTWYQDADNDGFGNAAATQQSCSQPTGYVANSTDCDDNDALEYPGQVWYDDTDSDGYGQTGAATITQCLRPTGYRAASELTSTTGDCNDANAAINPAATETCDGIDNNCNGSTDEGVQTTYYRDQDGDGFGNPAMTQMACSVPAGYVADNTDCNDNSALEKPGQVWYDDTDSDGYGQTGAATITQCLRPTGYRAASELTSTTGDCNDANAAINPAATETCDGIDNNCNGSTDEGVQATYYRDQDGDGFGNPAMTQMACSQPTGYVTDNTDCNDNSALEKPGQVWYDDTDSDGYGQTGAATITQCLRPTGYRAASELTATTGDCNDANAAINPAATEVCDGIDNNCNGSTDEGVQTTYYRDQDGDGFGNPAVTQLGCSQPSGYVANNTDCDDTDPLEQPGQAWYADLDNDGYSSGTTLSQCLRPAGYKLASELSATSGDCNDNNAAIKPGATEVCDGVDNNCNGSTDEGVQTTYYRDQDGDGFGSPAVTQLGCSLPAGYVINNTDCNDNSAIEKPGQVWYADTDNDGYSSGATLTQCLRPVGYKIASELTATTGDCNDSNAAIKPGALEICDGIDNDCDNLTDEGVKTEYFADTDGDGYGNPNSMVTECSQPQGYVTNDDDCDDTDDTVYPGAEEVCDRKDNDCNGVVDDIGGSTAGNWNHSDVGTANGSANFPPCEADPDDVFVINSSGFSTSSSDKLHAVYQTLCGNGEIIVHVLNVQNGGWAGVMLRETLDPGSKKVSLKTQLTPVIRREIRNVTNGAVNMLNFNRPGHTWLRLVRNGSNFIGYSSADGVTWDFSFSATVPMNGCLYAGLFAESINGSVETTATFDHVTIIRSTPLLVQGATANAPASAGVNLSVYPNPGNGNMMVSVANAPEHSNLQLEVTDALGRIVRRTALPEGAVFTYPLDLSDEKSGVYYLRLRSENGVEKVQRIVIQE